MNSSPLIIAEISGNHLGSLKRARELVVKAAWAGASAVKFQTFTPEQMVGDLSYTLTDGSWKGQKLIDLYRETHTPRDWHSELFDLARQLNITPLSTPFHPDDVQFLKSLNCPTYKIASFEITDIELISAAANTGKPLIISTGMADWPEIIEAAKIAPDAVYLKCTSAYPATAADANLATFEEFRRHGLRYGLSDHTEGVGVAVAATVLGAEVIEKHLTLSRSDGGPDAAFSLEPSEFAQLVTECRRAVECIGTARSGASDSERPQAALRRSLWWAEDLPAGTVIERQHVKSARPGDGLPPSALSGLIGQTLSQPVSGGTPCRWIGSGSSRI